MINSPLSGKQPTPYSEAPLRSGEADMPSSVAQLDHSPKGDVGFSGWDKSGPGEVRSSLRF